MKPSREEALAALRTLIQYIGEDPDREGLVGTPNRILKSYKELLCGYTLDPAEILKKSFTVGEYSQVIAVRDIPFTSFCEHHWLPFIGHAAVAYIPEGDRVVGLSKVARVVDVFAKRLQIQERMTLRIADAIEQNVPTLGVAVVLTASHQCMVCRGALKTGAKMVTSEMRGVFRDDAMARAEVVSLLGG